jgi:hypothetical protein
MEANERIVVDCTQTGWLATVRENLDQGLGVTLMRFNPTFYMEICRRIANLSSFEFNANEYHQSGCFSRKPVY